MVGKYKVITLCGSTRFKDAFIEAQKRLTLEGNIVISVGLFGHSGDKEVWTEGTKEMLDDMHKRKIDMADEIFVINVGGYIGSSTKSEIEYAKVTGKAIRYLESESWTRTIGKKAMKPTIVESKGISNEKFTTGKWYEVYFLEYREAVRNSHYVRGKDGRVIDSKVFERNLNGIDVILRVDDYELPFKHSFGEWWCDCGFSFRMGRLAETINYCKDHDELLMPEEVDGLANALTNLLDGKINEPQEYQMMEPDFVFMPYPIKDLRKDPKYSYVAPGYEFKDIYVEWRIFFWDGGITENYLTLTMYRDDIIAFRDFLESVRGSKNEW